MWGYGDLGAFHTLPFSPLLSAASAAKFCLVSSGRSASSIKSSYTQMVSRQADVQSTFDMYGLRAMERVQTAIVSRGELDKSTFSRGSKRLPGALPRSSM